MIKGRLEYVDIAKGFGLILVVGSHSDAFDLMRFMMDMCIPIFFFCSGYTFKMKGSFKEAIINKVKKLLAPYLFFNMFMLFVFCHFSLRDFLGVFYSRYCLFPLYETLNIKFFTSGNFPMWYLTSMIVSYLFFYLLIYCEKYKHAIMLLYALWIIGLKNCPILLPWSIDTAPLTAMLIYVGMKVRMHNMISMDIYQVLFLILLYLGLRCVSGDLNISVRIYGTSVAIYFLLAIIAPLVVLWGAKYMEGTFIGKVLLTLGQHSLTIFCIQMIFIVGVKELYHFIFPLMPIGYFVGLLEVFFALAGGWIVSLLFHKNKFLRRYILNL